MFKNRAQYPNILIPRLNFLPKALRIYFGKWEMSLRTKDKLDDRIKLMDLAFNDKIPNLTGTPKKDIQNCVIWQYWDEGISNAPELVKNCIRSVEINKGNLQHIVLSEENVFDLITLPDYILKKWNLINPTKKSNLIRLSLLSSYGGVWIDSTCFLNEEIPWKYRNSDIFMFLNTSNDRIIRSWFICSTKNNPIINALLGMHFLFYEKYTDPPCYFFFHYMLENLITMNSKIRKLWINSYPKVIFIQSITAWHVSLENQKKIDLPGILNQYWINKLSWKWDKDSQQHLNTILEKALNNLSGM